MLTKKTIDSSLNHKRSRISRKVCCGWKAAVGGAA